jgi:hypothetical protein
MAVGVVEQVMAGTTSSMAAGGSCLTYQQCRDLLESGQAIAYHGFTRTRIDERGEPDVAQLEIWQVVDARFSTSDTHWVGAE